MAVDEAILDGVIKERSPETIRFFDFEPRAVTVGRLQRLDASLLDACRRSNVDLVRRLTGGRMVVHAEDFTFSFVVRASNPLFGGTIYQTYQAVSAPFLSTLRCMGIPVEWRKAAIFAEKGKSSTASKSSLCFDAVSRYEIVVQGRKIVGISQYRRADTILVQGTLLLGKPEALYRMLFGSATSTGGFSSVADAHQGPVDFSMMASSLRTEIEGTYGVSLQNGALSSDESMDSVHLEEKYRAAIWREKGV
jgi:lipoate-protein ligase A